ncbi:MAG: hypothetical protein AB1512_02835 [Thermodesulfobacteriota bacterium]
MKGRIKAIYPEGPSSVYLYQCHGEEGRFSFPVEFRYHVEILDAERPLIGREIEYDDELDPPTIRFLD